MNQKILIIGLLFLCYSFTTNTISLSAPNKYIKSGENLTFIASFNVSGIMTDIAEVKMQTSTVKTKTRELLRLKCTASTYSSWDKFFKVRDLYESYVDPVTLLPSLFKRSIDEGGYKKQLKYLFKRNSNIAISTLNKKGRKNFKTNVSIDYSTLDIVSSIYKVRTLDFDKLSIEKNTTLKLIVDSKVQTVTVKYLGKENIKVANEESKPCYKLSIGFGGSEIENIKGSKFIWITADNDRLPTLIKANIPVGAIEIRLSNYTK